MKTGRDAMQNKVVLHFLGGELLKGTTADFFPHKDFFHLSERETGQNKRIDVPTLKAVFFVKDFDGDPAYREEHDMERRGFGRKMRVLFRDGETIIGYTQGFSPARQGFILFPGDPGSNNDRIFIVTAATEEINFL
jgi:hypothetical protein